MQPLHYGMKLPKPAPQSRGAGPITVERYVKGVLVERTEIPAPDGSQIKADFDQAKRGPKSAAEKRGEASQNYELNPW